MRKRRCFMRKRMVALLSVLLLGVSLLAATNASADASEHFKWRVSDAFLQSFTGLTQTGAVAEADNGDLARLAGHGRFDLSTGTAEGGGVFAHTDGDGTLLGFGKWKATGLEDFEPFGCDGAGFPENFCGGVLTLDVRLIGVSLSAGAAEFDGVLVIHCLIGPDVPEGEEEGVTLDIPGVIDFDEIVSATSGLTLFVALD